VWKDKRMKDELSHSKACILYEVNDICKKYKLYHELQSENELDAEKIRDQLHELPSSVQVRSGWTDLVSQKFTPEEFKIELSGGGPATRIIGELDSYGEVWAVKAQHQNWGIPWTDLELSKEQARAVTWFARLFYFGE